MPTADRADYALQSIRHFQRQDYPCRELIIVDSGADDLAARLPDDPRIRYLRAPAGMSIGAKRNRACEHARGDIIAQWDDDDWYAPERLSAQAAPLLAGAAEISGLTTGLFFDIARWQFWSCTPELHRRLFVEDVHGGTLVYLRRVWEGITRYPDRSLAEDALFLSQAVRRGARLHRASGAGLFIYLRHAGNSWAFACGQYLDPCGWRRAAEPPLPAEDRTFYATRLPAAPPAAPNPPAGAPLVSCIMPTCDRRAFVPHALAYFQRQDYPCRELIVVDDGDDPVADLMPADPRVRYIRLERRLTVGAKRNLACQHARGDVIAHWDDDDWHAPHRLRYQAEALASASAELCGITTLLFYDLRSRRAWRYVYGSHQNRWLAGSTLCYTRDFWARHPFAPVNVGEDSRFVASGSARRLLALPDHTFHVGIIHHRNVSPKQTGGSRWQPCPEDEIRRLLQADWDRYQGAH